MCDISDNFPVFTCKKIITYTCKQISMTCCYKVGSHSEVNMIKLCEKLSNESWNVIYDTMLMKPVMILSILSQHYILNVAYRNVQPKNPLVNHGSLSN